jgi:ketosteroid isomerase-like protein
VRDLARDDGGPSRAAVGVSVDRERVQGLYDTINRVWGDDPSRHMDLMQEYADPEIELVVPSEYLDIGDLRGYDGLARWMSMAATVFESWHYVVEDVLDAGEDSVLALVRLRVRGRASGAEMQFDAAHLLDFAGGRVRRLAVYRDRAEGLAAAGLS